MAVNNNVPLSRRYRTRAEECRRLAESLHGAETQIYAAFELQQADELARSPDT
jgi:hypothetical protein